MNLVKHCFGSSSFGSGPLVGSLLCSLLCSFGTLLGLELLSDLLFDFGPGLRFSGFALALLVRERSAMGDGDGVFLLDSEGGRTDLDEEALSRSWPRNSAGGAEGGGDAGPTLSSSSSSSSSRSRVCSSKSSCMSFEETDESAGELAS